LTFTKVNAIITIQPEPTEAIYGLLSQDDNMVMLWLNLIYNPKSLCLSACAMFR